MSRNPVRPLTGVLISTLMILMASLFAAAPASAVPESTTRAAIEFDTDLTLKIAKCEGCVVSLLSYDGANPIHETLPQTVTAGSVTFTLPSAKTSGMSVRIRPTWITDPVAADTNVVWRYGGKAIGDSIGLKEARGKTRASGCWAGTVNEAVTLTVKVRQVTYRGRTGAIAWAPVTESFVPPMERIRGGVLVSDDVLSCNTYR